VEKLFGKALDAGLDLSLVDLQGHGLKTSLAAE
jgi:hypothetical protein